MKNSLNLEYRIVSVLSYCSYGLFGLIWLVYCQIVKKMLSDDILFNILQSIFISFFMAVVSVVYGFLFDIFTKIPIISHIVSLFDFYMNKFPIMFNMSIIGIVILMLYIYLIVISILGKKPYVPFASEIIRQNFGV